jgi:hypothetical protein
MIRQKIIGKCFQMKSQKSSSLLNRLQSVESRHRPLRQTSKFMLFYCDEIISIMMMKGLFSVVVVALPHRATIFLICKFTQVFPLNFFLLCFHFSLSFFIFFTILHSIPPLKRNHFRIVCSYIFTLFTLFFFCCLDSKANTNSRQKDLSENE